MSQDAKPRWTPFVTVAAIALRETAQGPEVLLVEEHTPEGLKLNHPAGHLEPGETPEQGAMREALEESARTFTPQRFLGAYLTTSEASGVSYLRLAFVGQVGEPDLERALDAGIVRSLWMGVNDLRSHAQRLRSPAVLQGTLDALAGRGAPLDLVRA